MEGYKSLVRTVEDAAKIASCWKYIGDGTVYTKEELLALGKLYDENFPLDEWSYFVYFPTGEIGMLLTVSRSVDIMFLPLEEAGEGKYKLKVDMDFCSDCGQWIKADESFCPFCGKATGQGPVAQEGNNAPEAVGFCQRCGAHMDEEDNFCPACGVARPRMKAEGAGAGAAG